MFVGSFYRVRTKGDIDRMVAAASASAIIYVEDEHKFYEKTPFGMVMDYNLIPPITGQSNNTNEVKETKEVNIDDSMEKRVKELEEAMKNLNNMIGGNIDAI